MNKVRPNTTKPVAPVATVQEYSIRMAKKSQKQRHLMKFNYNLNVNFDKWTSIEMERENNLKQFKGLEAEKHPKFGAGSEYNKDEKEEARRLKLGIKARKYNPNAQPWIMKDGNRKFRGTREGGIGDNSSYYVFAHCENGTIEAYPLDEWYSFQPIQRFKPLTAEQAEEEFAKRTSCFNKWSMKIKMQLNNNTAEDAEDAEELKSKKKVPTKSALKITDMDEFMHSSDESSSDEDKDDDKKEQKTNDDAKAKQKKAKGKAAVAKRKKKERDLDDEAFEESDDGDEEGKEHEYIESSDSDSEPEAETNKNQLKSVAEEETLTSSDDSEDEDKKVEEKTEEEKNEKVKQDNKMLDILNDTPVEEVKENRTKMEIFNDAMNRAPGGGNKSDFSADSDEEDVKPIKKDKEEKKKKKESKDRRDKKDKKESKDKKLEPKASASSSSVVSDATKKRKHDSPPTQTEVKKIKTEASSSTPIPTPFTMYSSSTSKDIDGLTEESVRRYLLRKPMTTTELITKFRKIKTVKKDNLVETMTSILKRINPIKQTIQGKMYLSLKEM
ncbi:unnamed protein product [Diamesa serratosioi]